MIALMGPPLASGASAPDRFSGRFYAGEGDVEYLQLLDTARRLFEPDPEYQNMAMLYNPVWDGLVEGPTWGAWWIQNSYGPTYCALPFWQEPFVTFVQNSQDLWFDQMGDGKRVGGGKWNWVAPDGCLCDAAAPNWIYYKQGDGRVDIHDWGMEFTAAGVVLQAEALLIRRDPAALAHYLPKLERCADFLDSRRDPKNNLYLAGPAGNLLAPSYAAWKKPDGTYDKAYLAGLSVTTIAALDRLIELEKMAGNAERVRLFSERRDLSRQGLAQLTTDEGYLIKSLDPDGTRHGVYGAAQHGYFEAICNHDAICFRVADDAQAERIYAKIAAIPGLRPYDLIITNCPSLDDLYVEPKGLWEFGRWVNGGHWSTCEARMIMAYYRLGKHEDARRSMKRILGFARQFRMDNNLTHFGSEVYQPKEPINCVYDAWGIPAAFVRGLFEYLYQADRLVIVPHIPPGITRLEQHFPIRFGAKRLFLRTYGVGPVTAVTVNGRDWRERDAKTVALAYDALPVGDIQVDIMFGGARPAGSAALGAALLPPQSAQSVADWTVLAKDLYPVISTNDLPLRLGADSRGENRFVGDLGPCRVYSRALSPEEMAALAQGQPGALDSDPALVGNWAFDRPDAAGFANARGEGLVAKATAAAPVTDSPHGKAVRFDGQAYLEVANDPRLQLDRACTLAAWVKPGVLPPTGVRIIDKCKVGTNDGYMLDTCPGNGLRLIVGWGAVGFAANLPPDQWAHVGATVAPDGTLALYLNGKPVARRPAPGGPPDLVGLQDRVARLARFDQGLWAAGLGDVYEAAHARLVVDCLDACHRRLELQAAGKLTPLPPESQSAADRSYFSTVVRLAQGLEKVLDSYANSADPGKKRVHEVWAATLAAGK